MRRRLTLAILATVAFSLLLAGIGTFVLTRLADRQAIEDDLVRQAETIAVVVDTVRRGDPATDDLAGLGPVRRGLLDEDVFLIGVRPSGEIAGAYPPAVPADAIRRAAVEGSESGRADDLAYGLASASARIGRAVPVVIVVGADDRATAPAAGWLLVSILAGLLIAALVARWLATQLSTPLREASQATEAIANGDLETRLPTDDRTELGDLSRSINEMAESLERSRGLDRQFLLSVSHDLRTPLTSIRGYAEAIADEATPDPRRAAEVIQAESRRLERLVDDLLQLANLEARRFELRVAPVDLNEVVEEVLAGFGRAAADAGISLRLTGAVKPHPLATDRDRIGQVVANLVENALRFAATEVIIDVSSTARSTAVVVSDDGPGIPEAERARIFERLYVSTRQPVRRGGGTGLGLTIAKELIEALGGTIEALNRPTGGAQVVIVLPSDDREPLSPA